MPRPVKIRAHYRTDAAFLLRLETAVGIDPNRRESWKKKTCEHIRIVVQDLLSADVEQERSSKPRPEAAGVGRK